MSVTLEHSRNRRGVAGRTRNASIDPDPMYSKRMFRVWAAGLLEFNGSVVNGPHGVRVTIQSNVAQGEEVLARLRNVLGGSVSHPPACEGKVRWTLTGSRVVDMLAALRKYLSAARVREIETKLAANNPTNDDDVVEE